MPKTKTVRVIPFADIESRFRLVPLVLGFGVHPAVAKKPDGYSIRIDAGSSVSGRNVTDRFDYFRLDVEGNITEAPRGYAKDYRPGRIPVGELDAAVAKYAEAVRRG